MVATEGEGCIGEYRHIGWLVPARELSVRTDARGESPLASPLAVGAAGALRSALGGEARTAFMAGRLPLVASTAAPAMSTKRESRG